ncbi:MAG: type II toxin-antitoxin system HicA family toxin [Treponema sp.]|nr:type II toxin-antitoxin system HicA family toxin [Treponema sp.]
MKRLDLVRIIEQNGAVLVRYGSDHDWYKNPNTGIAESVPQHR